MTSIGYSISTANHDGYFVLLNTAWERTLGYTLNELRTKPFIEFVHPDDREATLLEVQKLYEQQTNVSFVNRYRTKSGEYRWLSWNAVVASGTELIYSITRDITKGKEEEEYLQMLESVVINGEDCVLITETESINLPGPRIVYANEAMCRMTGYSMDEIIGATPRIFQGPLTEREPLEKIRKALQAWESVNVELINHKKDGMPFYVNISIYPVANKQGWYTHWISIQRDITEKREIDIQLKENEANLQALINNTQDIIFSIGREKNLLTFNQTFAFAWKESHGSLPEKGHTFASLWKDLPTDFWENKLIEVFQGNPLLDQDVSIKGKDGIHYYRCSFNPIQNEGKVIGCTVFIKDITKRKHAELQLRASQSVMASLIDSQTSYLIRIDLEGYYSFANPAFVNKFGYGENEDPPIHSRESVHPDDWPAVEEAVWFCLMNPGEMKSLEIRKPLPEGLDIWTEWEFVSFLDNEGNIGGIQAVGQDITEKKYTVDENKFLANILTKVNDSVVLTNLEGKIIYVNQGTENLWGYVSEELLDQYPNILFPKIDLEWMKTIRDNLTKEKSYTGEARGLNKNGEEIFVLLETSILTDSEDVPIGFLSIAKDITQRKKAEMAIKVSEAHLRSMIDATNHAFALLDLKGNIITFNNQAKEDCLSLFNYPLEKQQNLFAIFSRYPQEFIPYMVEEIVKGRTIAGVDVQKTIHGDDFWIDYLIAPARDDEGHVFGICINVTNITALKEAEQQVQAVNQRFRMAAESGNLGVWGWNILKSKLMRDEGMYNLYGVRPSDPRDPQEIWISVVHQEDQGYLTTYFPESLADPTKLEMDMDYKIVLPNGETRFLRSPGHIVRNKEGQAISATGICFDISDIKTAEMELRRAKELAEEMNRLKSNFLANMSHEIRTPLNGILGLLPVLELEKDPEEINFMINMMQKSGQRLLSTLTGILELARLEAEQAEYRMEILYLNDLVLDIFEALRSATIGRDFQYQLIQAESDTAVLADERLLSQILTNIIGNAIKFTQEGSVRVSVIDKFHYKKHVYTAIRVEDTGVGIAQENQNRIFDPFKQESEGSTRQFEGSGLGLSIAKKYTTMMGGDILLESEKHKGSIFTVYLPKQVS